MARVGQADSDPEGSVNEVVLVGRLAAPATERTLRSGDVLLTWRLIVRRPASTAAVAGPGRPVTVDTVDCAAWTASVRRTVAGLDRGDVVRVVGALRRRFWQSGQGAVSSYQVEAAVVSRLARAHPSR